MSVITAGHISNSPLRDEIFISPPVVYNDYVQWRVGTDSSKITATGGTVGGDLYVNGNIYADNTGTSSSSMTIGATEANTDATFTVEASGTGTSQATISVNAVSTCAANFVLGNTDNDHKWHIGRSSSEADYMRFYYDDGTDTHSAMLLNGASSITIEYPTTLSNPAPNVGATFAVESSNDTQTTSSLATIRVAASNTIVASYVLGNQNNSNKWVIGRNGSADAEVLRILYDDGTTHSAMKLSDTTGLEIDYPTTHSSYIVTESYITITDSTTSTTFQPTGGTVGGDLDVFGNLTVNGTDSGANTIELLSTIANDAATLTVQSSNDTATTASLASINLSAPATVSANYTLGNSDNTNQWRIGRNASESGVLRLYYDDGTTHAALALTGTTGLEIDYPTTHSAAVVLDSSIAASSTSTGALVVDGGVGVSGDIYAGSLNSDGAINADAGIIVSTAAAASTLDVYQEETLTGTVSGALTSANFDVLATRIGNIVQLTWGSVSGATGTPGSLALSAVVTSDYQPPYTINHMTFVNTDSLDTFGILRVDTSGNMTWTPGANTSANFTGNCAIHAGSLSYNV